MRADNTYRSLAVHPENTAPASVEIANDLTHEGVGDTHLHQRNRLEENGLGLLYSLTKSVCGGDPKGDVLGVQRMRFTVIDGYSDIDNLKATQYASV